MNHELTAANVATDRVVFADENAAIASRGLRCDGCGQRRIRQGQAFGVFGRLNVCARCMAKSRSGWEPVAEAYTLLDNARLSAAVAARGAYPRP